MLLVYLSKLLKNKSNEQDSENNNLNSSSNSNYESNPNSGPEQDPEDEDFIKKTINIFILNYNKFFLYMKSYKVCLEELVITLMHSMVEI